MTSERLDIPCPECNRTLKVTAQDVIRQRSVRCPSGHAVQLRDEKSGMARAERELRKLDKNFRL